MKAHLSAICLAITSFSTVASAQTWGQQPGSQPGWGGTPTNQPPPGGGLSAGGLAPPASNPGDPNAPNAQTERELEKADREDSGRGLEFFWLNAEIGGEHLGLQTFKANQLVDAGTVKTSQTGLLYGAGLGVRLVFITLGARFRMGQFSEWALWTLNAELGLHIPIGSIEPYFTLGGGYASMGSFNENNLGGSLRSQDVDIKGYDVRGGFGVDVYVSDTFSIGANLTGEMLVLTRPGVDPSRLQGSTGGQQSASDIYKADGSSIGAGATLTAVAGLHF
ncbi:MAG: hypothetical protein U0263_01245 [Polyangiaceae bacterium]